MTSPPPYLAGFSRNRDQNGKLSFGGILSMIDSRKLSSGKMTNPIARIKAVRGMAAKIARALRLHAPAVSRWKRVPAEHVMKVEKITGIPRDELRPDLYPPNREQK